MVPDFLQTENAKQQFNTLSGELKELAISQAYDLSAVERAMACRDALQAVCGELGVPVRQLMGLYGDQLLACDPPIQPLDQR